MTATVLDRPSRAPRVRHRGLRLPTRGIARADATSALREQARRDARGMLTYLWTAGDDWAELPVDPTVIARRLGIRVVEADIEDVAGGLVKQPGRDPAIVLNRDDRPNRQRVVCAHELGHYVLRKDDLTEYYYDDLRDEVLASPEPDDEERYANEFAVALVIPEAELRRAVKQGMPEVVLAWRFDVAREAMQYRLAGLGMTID